MANVRRKSFKIPTDLEKFEKVGQGTGIANLIASAKGLYGKKKIAAMFDEIDNYGKVQNKNLKRRLYFVFRIPLPVILKAQ